MSPSAWILYNPYAGRANVVPFIERAKDVLVRAGWQARLESTDGPRHATEIARDCAEAGCDALFVSGGDGTVSEAASGLLGTDTALGVLPSGTANLWARELGLQGLSWTYWTALEDAARQQCDGLIHRADVGRCNGMPFLLWAGVGLDAHVIHRIEPRPPWLKPLGVPYYVAAAFMAGMDWAGIDLDLRVDGATVSGHYLLATVGNIRGYGGGLFDLSPEARVDDGLLELTLFEGRSFSDTLQRTAELWTGRHLSSPSVHRLRGRSIEIRSTRGSRVHLDGEPVPLTTPVTIEVEALALRVLVPRTFRPTIFHRSPIGNVRSESIEGD